MRFSKKNQKSAQSVLMLDILAIITFALVACGSDSVSDAVNPSPVSEVETRFELGKCTNELEGTSVYVTQERGDYICKNNIWTRDGGGEYYPLSSDLSVYSSSSFLKYSSIMSYSLSSSSFSFEKSQSSSSEEKSSSQIKSSSSSIYSSSSFLKYSSITSYSLSSSSFSSEKSQSSSFEEKSSSQVKSSSSSIDVFSSDCESSSSSKMKEAWNFLNKNISYGEITDSRDGQVYKTVEIGDQVWMAENLNFDYNESVTATSFCYNNRADSCLKYGRLYTWVAAMKACPDEWHVPTDREWETLINFDKNCGPDGKCLKSVNGWNRAGATNGGGGRDDYGFAILPAGYRNDKDRGAFSSIGTYAKFWTAIEIGPNYAKYIDAYVMDVYSNSISIYKNNAHSVRCIKGARQVSNLREPVLYDYMTDSRDGQVYPIVTIGTQTWMAQNLNYDNRDKNKQHFTWKTALTSCPDGWHLPSNAEWNILIEYVGGDELKLQYIQSWSTNGTDDYLFSAKYTDYRGYGDGAYFWSSTKENGSTYALFMGHPVRLDKEAENNMRSVRCLKNFD